MYYVSMKQLSHFGFLGLSVKQIMILMALRIKKAIEFLVTGRHFLVDEFTRVIPEGQEFYTQKIKFFALTIFLVKNKIIS